MLDAFRAWLRRRADLVKVTIGFLVLVLALSALSYLGNEPVELPESVPFVGGARLPSLNANAECLQDPALAAPTLLPAPPSNADGRPLNYLHTCGNRIYDSNGREAVITGVNWFGMETGTYAPHGLWTRNWQSMLDQIAQLGYNTVRLPFSNEMLNSPGPTPVIDYVVNPDLAGLSGVELIDKVIDGARQRGLRVVLDRHRPTSAGQSSLWYTADVDERRWIDDWVKLAHRYARNDTVIAFDLHNEPRDNATWGSGDPATDWRLAAERAGNAILGANPYLLIFVEGVATYENDYYWWGGHLAGVAKNPVALEIPNRVVYSPHDYGPEVYEQGWFDDPNFPKNLPSVWDNHWGYIARRNLAPVVVGEFGGRSVGNDPAGVWQRSLLDYMRRNRIGFFNWSLNPNSGDTGGVLSDDWLGVMNDKQSVYSLYLAPPIAEGPDGRFGAPPAKVHVLTRATNGDARTANISFSVQVVNDGAQPLYLSEYELRYWLKAGPLRGRTQIAEIDYAALGKDHVQPAVVAETRGQQDSYVRLRFGEGTPPLAAYQASGEIMVRVHKSDWSAYTQADAFSFTPRGDWFQWTQVGLYRGGELVWGSEPTP